MNMCLFFILFAFDMLPSYETVIPGSRLLDFPNPDFSQTIHIPGGRAVLNHNFGSVPFHVRVYATSTDGNNANFVFEGTGAMQNDGKDSNEPPSGLIFAYDANSIHVWTPRGGNRIISVGGVWGDGTHSQNSNKVKVTVEAWRSGPLPSFETKIEINSKVKSTFKIPHPLLQLPEIISVRVSPVSGRHSGLHFHAIGASQTASKARMLGGVIFSYNIADIVIWTPNKPKTKTGCVAVNKYWGKKNIISQSCYVEIRLWVNSFPPPIFQSDWTTITSNDNTRTFIEIQHKLRLLPTYVRVQYRFKHTVHPLVFEGSGSVQTTQLGNKNRFGGVLFAYDKVSVRIWLPRRSRSDKKLSYIIFVGDGWGDSAHPTYNNTAEFRVEVFADKCMDKTRVVDALGYCRDIREVELTQKMARWEKCSNPCGNGTKTRRVQGCTGRTLQNVINCNFEKDFCGFQRSGFNWSRGIEHTRRTSCNESVEDLQQMEKRSEFLNEVLSKEPNFIYSTTKPCIRGKRINMATGHLITGDLGNAMGCILTFKYTADSYFSKFIVEAQAAGTSSWKELWVIQDGQVRRGVWHSAYLDIGNYLEPLKKLRFTHKLPYSSFDQNPKCPEKCHSILLTNITLKCEKDDLHVVEEDRCKEKQLPLPSCIINAYKPFSKGKAWSVLNSVKNEDSNNIGSFVTAVGNTGDLIATYVFNIKIYNIYHIWFDSFALDNKTNGITVEINDEERYQTDLIYNSKSSLWLPLVYEIAIQAGEHVMRLYQKEKYFKFRNLMIAPRNISVWSALGLQSQLIPVNNFMTLSGISSLLGYSRLNGEGGWMPSDDAKGIYLQIQLPELALLKKIATQGATAIGGSYNCWTSTYKVKFSLDRESFAYYRKKIKDVNEYEFLGNTDHNGITEHTFSYALVARAIRIYPENYTYRACLRVELYGFYMVKGMCPEITAKTREKNCTGNRICSGTNMHCAKDAITRHSKCECNNGYHGGSCNMTGCDPNPCKDGSCIIRDGNFRCDCRPGFYGTYCQLRCPKGWYGKNCSHECKCPDGKYCDPANGACSCFPGYEGINCDKKCPNLTYGQDCSKKCSCLPPLHCDHETGDCYCSDGYQGDNCDMKCSNDTYGRNCTKGCNCYNGGTCQSDGKCACLPGWFADDCEFPCPKGRFGLMCSEICPRHGNSSCDRVTGEIKCAKGFTGRFCHEPCRKDFYGEGCKKKCQCVEANTKDRTCRKDTGSCVCKPGWRGEICNSKCEHTWGEGCKHKCLCKNGGTCDHVTGSCTCLKGHNGTHCEKVCAEGYYGLNCTNQCDCDAEKTDRCHPADGRCICNAGHKGVRCEDVCDRKHWGRDCAERCMCSNDAVCDTKDGYCFCGEGYHGERCDKLCDKGKYGRNCAETCKCKNGADCDREHGRCDCRAGYVGRFCEKKCKDFRYGIDCRSPCPCARTQTLKCDHVNGSCYCKPGFKGKRCDEECDDGFYGHKCQNVCDPCRHSHHACNKINGTCSCIDGFTGSHCMDDCEMSRYGPACSRSCECDQQFELCDNLNGTCYKKSHYTFTINLLINLYTFKFYLNAQEKLKENLALFVWNCLKGPEINSHCMEGNASKYSNIPVGDNKVSRDEQLRKLKLINTFFVRIVDLKSRFSSDNEEVTVVSLTLLNNTVPVNGSKIEDFLSHIPSDILSSALKHKYYKGQTYAKKRTLDPINSKMRWIVIGLSAFGGLLTVFLVCLICRCTTRVPYPPPFQKVRRDSKDFEMEANMTCNSHLLAFENPYYDIIAAMGLDDDVEEDYYNPLYDNMLELHSDSETEPEDMYYSFRNNNYHRGGQYPYDKDSGFSSGTLM